MQNTTHKFTTLLLTMFTLTSVAACNTLEGAGRDIENAGDRIEDATD